MAEIKAIETHYNGNRFRSRLEARWAVFFDTMGIEYLYEPEGFKMQDGTCYLPDFYLPKMNEFFEVKGKLKLTDMHKIDTFVKEYNRTNIHIRFCFFLIGTVILQTALNLFANNLDIICKLYNFVEVNSELMHII